MWETLKVQAIQKLNFTGIFGYAEKRNCFQWPKQLALEWHIGISQGVCGTGGWTTLSLSQWEVLRDEFEGFLGGSLKAFGAPWEHIWAQPEQAWPWKQLQQSLCGSAWPAYWSILPWMTLFNSRRLIPLTLSTQPSHPNAPHSLSLNCSSPAVSSVLMPLGNAIHDLWLGKHLTKCIPFQIWDYILLFQYLGASE